MFDSYRWFMDEVLAAVRAGFDGVAVTEHGQTSYDMMPNPNLPAAVLANAIRTERPETALIVLGRSLGKTREPLRIAEEYAMLDCLSGGRLVAGLPVGLSYDANLNNGIPTVETRERYEEAVELMFRSWTARQPFTWNGRFSQYSLVNSWPRPLQQPHPPVWVPGSGSPGTMQWTIDEDYRVRLPGLVRTRRSRRAGSSIDTGSTADENGVPRNPYRLAFVQNVVVAETDERAEVEYGRYVENAFRQGVGSVPLHYMGLPGYVDPRGVETMLRDPGDLGLAAELKHATFGRLAEARSVIAGSPATVRDQILEFAKEFRIGNLLVMLQMGGMPHDLTMKNIHLFAEEVLPHLQSRVGPTRTGRTDGGRPGFPSRWRSEMTWSVMNITERVVPVWGSRLDMTVQVAGDGPPLVYLHAAGGMVWDPFLERLAADSHRSTRRSFPARCRAGRRRSARSTTCGISSWSTTRRSRALDLERPPVVGQSFGGMLACELAAHFPALFSRVVLLDPIGLWLDDHPVANWVAAGARAAPGSAVPRS